jgi:hypothetical protein
MPKIDPKTFNTDPKHETERGAFDEMVEGSVKRLKEKAEKNPPASPPAEKGFIDELFDDIFGK